ncbi:cytochrome b [Colwellia psychrerythraea]|uniref:Di-heme cytochrome, transmembrane n=1 Tax=Colwellia psychrerythraea TaxID=28229 RepID=A0A099L170_COLPS|nr:cytochrome b [Colwellia psychrerythraea]KGJ96180.1 Di-heme cytochrome, transmembrane [Colwellia psychrerythraea]
MSNNIFKNTESSYGLIAIIFHWLMAVAIFSLFGLGLYMVELTYYDAWYKGSLDLHKNIGMTLFVALMLRVFWRVVNVTPKNVDQSASKLEVKSAHYAHVALYALMAILMISGYLISTADGRAIDIFGLLSIPALPISINNQEDIAGNIHEILAWTLVLLSAGHALAALKHHFINKNNTLVRMLKVLPRK